MYIYICRYIFHDRARSGTISGSDSLAPRREIQGFLHRHFPNMNVVLADVCGRLLRHELVELVPVVGHLPSHLLNPCVYMNN